MGQCATKGREPMTREEILRDQAWRFYRALRNRYVATQGERERRLMERMSRRYSRRAMKTNRGY
jgi:hypothetical protein